MHLRKVLVISKTGVNYRKRGKIKKNSILVKILKIIITKNCKILDVFLMQPREVLVISETVVNYRNKHGKN